MVHYEPAKIYKDLCTRASRSHPRRGYAAPRPASLKSWPIEALFLPQRSDHRSVTSSALSESISTASHSQTNGASADRYWSTCAGGRLHAFRAQLRLPSMRLTKDLNLRSSLSTFRSRSERASCYGWLASSKHHITAQLGNNLTDCG